MLAILHTLVDWCRANPSLSGPVISAVLVFFFKPQTRQAYRTLAARKPTWLFSRVAAFWQLLGAGGPDPRKIRRAVSKMLTGKQDPPEPTSMKGSL